MTTPINTTYVTNVPLGNQQINNTQETIKDNFQDIYNLVGINHINFNTPNTFGTHNIVDYFSQTIDPSTADNEIAMYAKYVQNDSNISELFYRYPNNGSVIQLTGQATNTQTGIGSGGGQVYLTYGTPAQIGWQYLTNGMLMMWGLTSNFSPTTASGAATFGYLEYAPSGVPSFSATPFHMQFCMQYPGSLSGGVQPPYGQVYITPISSTEFTINFVGNPYGTDTGLYYNWSAFWLAIGV